MYWYQCKKCGTTIKNDSIPSYNGCPSAPLHDWQKLGEVGNTNYQCKKCGTIIQMDSMPFSGGCPAGSIHDWRKL